LLATEDATVYRMLLAPANGTNKANNCGRVAAYEMAGKHTAYTAHATDIRVTSLIFKCVTRYGTTTAENTTPMMAENACTLPVFVASKPYCSRIRMGNCDVNRDAPSPNTREYSRNNAKERFVVNTVYRRPKVCVSFPVPSEDDEDGSTTDCGSTLAFTSTEAKHKTPPTIATFARPIADDSGPLDADPST
jgi:hypothetical protein